MIIEFLTMFIKQMQLKIYFKNSIICLSVCVSLLRESMELMFRINKWYGNTKNSKLPDEKIPVIIQMKKTEESIVSL